MNEVNSTIYSLLTIHYSLRPPAAPLGLFEPKTRISRLEQSKKL